MTPRHLACSIDEFFGTVGIEGLNLGIGAGERPHSCSRVLARSLAARLTATPVCPKVE